MNTLSLNLHTYQDNHALIKDGIFFKNVQIIAMQISNDETVIIDTAKTDYFIDSLVVFDELQSTLNPRLTSATRQASSNKNSGQYLIFTCACGIADDGGWNYVQITAHDETVENIEWRFEVADKHYHFVFDKSQYTAEINKISSQIQVSTLPLEPTNIIFPTD